MVRPVKGERSKKPATITVDPIQWTTFQENVKTFLPDPSASAHIETLIRNENARFAGEDGASNPKVNEAALQRHLRSVERERLEIWQIMDKAKAVKRICQLMVDIGLTDFNGKEVLRKLALDQDKEGSVVDKFLKDIGNESDVQLLINLIEICDEGEATSQKLREVQKKKYAGKAPEQTQTALPPSLEKGRTQIQT